MFPYQFEPSQPAPPPAPTPAPRPAPRRHRAGTAALLALALTGTTVGGGAIGAVAATRYLTPPPASSQPASIASAVTAQPVASAAAPVSNVAGAVFAQANPAVVQVVTSGQTFGGLTPSGSGSGFVVDARGLILTNYHVVADARAVSVTFSSGEDREAQVLGFDRGNDLALLKVDLPANVPVATLGDSDQTQVGETAIAIGSPFGLDQTVTQGIISAVDRDWQPGSGRTQRNLLQTDTPINPGNSGGPLLNARGEVIGINTMIESPVRGSVGVGFAVPINTARRLLTQLEAGAQIEPVWLGISGLPLDATIARDQGLAVEQGVLVTSVVPGGPAEQAGLRGGQGQNERIPRGGDVIAAIDGQAVTDLGEIADQLSVHKPGDSVALTVIRDGQEQTVTVILQPWPEQTQ